MKRKVKPCWRDFDICGIIEYYLIDPSGGGLSYEYSLGPFSIAISLNRPEGFLNINQCARLLVLENYREVS